MTNPAQAVREALRECPFCGGAARRVDFPATDGEVNAGGSLIECTACFACSPVHFDRKENLYSSWNDRRALSPTPDNVRLVEATIAECARAVPTNWCDPLLTGPDAPKGPLDNHAVEALLRGIQDRIRALAASVPDIASPAGEDEKALFEKL